MWVCDRLRNTATQSAWPACTAIAACDDQAAQLGKVETRLTDLRSSLWEKGKKPAEEKPAPKDGAEAMADAIAKAHAPEKPETPPSESLPN